MEFLTFYLLGVLAFCLLILNFNEGFKSYIDPEWYELKKSQKTISTLITSLYWPIILFYSILILIAPIVTWFINVQVLFMLYLYNLIIDKINCEEED